MATVGVDVGGGGVRAALVDDHGETGCIHALSLSGRSVDEVLDAVERVVRRAARGHTLSGLGVAVPGFVRPGGVVAASPNFPSWREEEISRQLRRRLGCPVAVENDANAAALGAWAQAGRSRDLVLLTLGTGVGGGVVSAGQLLRGAGGTGAELGHLFVGGDQPCGCGGQGCLETWCGTVGLIRRAEALGAQARTGLEIVEAAERSEVWARDLLAHAAHHLGLALVSLVNLFNPDVVALAGGLSGAQRWLAPAEATLQARGIAANVERVELRWLGRAEPLAILGAAELVS